MKWNPFNKKEAGSKEVLPTMPGMPAMEDLNMFQRFAMKRLMKMNPAEREKMMKKAMTPKNIEKNKGEILASLETMRKSGQISDDQYRLTKAKLGLK
ncbi:MAG: hypothetical protein WAV46_03645 [Candidatus Moraniibacteriota bacterium]